MPAFVVWGAFWAQLETEGKLTDFPVCLFAIPLSCADKINFYVSHLANPQLNIILYDQVIEHLLASSEK